MVGWCLNDNTRDKDDTTVGVGHSRRYCNTGYDQSQGRRPSTLKCIGSISKGDIEPPTIRQKLIRNRTASRLTSDGRSRRYVQYRADQSQTETILHEIGWLLGFYDSTRDKDDTTVGVGHSRRYCNTGYDQSQGRRPSTLKCIGPISKGDTEPNHPSEINPNSDSRSRSDGRSPAVCAIPGRPVSRTETKITSLSLHEIP